MPLLKVEADKLSNNQLVQGVIEEIITEDQLFELLPFKQVQGKGYIYNREKTLSEPDFLDPNDTVTEGAATFEECIARVRALIGDVDVDNFLAQTESDENDQAAIQIAAKAKALGRKWRRTIINGSAYTAAFGGTAPAGFITASEVSDGNGTGSGTLEIDVAPSLQVRYTAPGDSAGAWVAAAADGRYTVRSANSSKYLILTLDVSEAGVADATVVVTLSASKEFTGLKFLVDPNQEISAGTNGAALSFALLDQLVDLVMAGPANGIFMHERTIRSYKTLLRAAGGVDSAMLQLPNFGQPILTFSGIPIFKNNYITTTETQGTGTNLTRIYAAWFDENKGVTALFGGRNAGVVVENVGIVQNKDATRTRVKQYGGLAVHSTLSLACIKAITN